jgi:hypothetical protein
MPSGSVTEISYSQTRLGERRDGNLTLGSFKVPLPYVLTGVAGDETITLGLSPGSISLCFEAGVLSLILGMFLGLEVR